MKIIRKGILPVEVFAGTCRNCKCEVECDKSEVKVLPGDRAYDPSVDYVTCPTPLCGERIYVAKK